MNEDVLAVERETALKEVASLLVEQRISGVPVVDSERKVLGVVSEADILVKERGTRPE
jgi:CBS domain-containing protein